MRVIGFIAQPALIDRILDHLRRRDKILARLRSPRSLWPHPLEIRPARRSQAARKGGRVGTRSRPASTRLWASSSPTGAAQVGLPSRRAAPAAGSTGLPRRSPRAVARAP